MAAQIGRYAHARQLMRMRKMLKALRIRLARFHREGTRKIGQLPEQSQAKAKNRVRLHLHGDEFRSDKLFRIYIFIVNFLKILKIA